MFLWHFYDEGHLREIYLKIAFTGISLFRELVSLGKDGLRPTLTE